MLTLSDDSQKWTDRTKPWTSGVSERKSQWAGDKNKNHTNKFCLQNATTLLQLLLTSIFFLADPVGSADLIFIDPWPSGFDIVARGGGIKKNMFVWLINSEYIIRKNDYLRKKNEHSWKSKFCFVELKSILWNWKIKKFKSLICIEIMRKQY